MFNTNLGVTTILIVPGRREIMTPKYDNDTIQHNTVTCYSNVLSDKTIKGIVLDATNP